MTMSDRTDDAEITRIVSPLDPSESVSQESVSPESLSTEAPSSGPLTSEVFVEEDDAPPSFVETSDESSRSTSEAGGPRRSAAALWGRAVIGIVVIAVLAVVVGATLLPWPSAGVSAKSVVVTPVPASQQVVCPGGLLRLASASGAGATTVSSIGTPIISSAAASGNVQAKSFAHSNAGTAGSAAAPQLLTSPSGSGSAPTLLAGSQSQSVSTDEFTGLAAEGCTSATGDVWLDGGATTVGRTTLLLLANPSDVPAVVSLQIYGENGPVTAPGMSGIGVPAGAQRVLSLAGFATNLASPVVHVESAGGQIVATLEQSTVRGVTPGGIDFIGGQPQPTTTTVIPGVVLAGTQAVQSQLGQSGFDDLETTLRVYLPGSKPVTAAITVVPENGTVTAKPIKTSLQPGTVTDLPLDQLSQGSYTVIVTASVPLVASVRVSTAGSSAVKAATDFAWLTAAPLLTGDTMVSIPTGMTPRLHLENPTAKTENVQLKGSDGTSISTSVAPHSATTVSVAAGGSYTMSGFTGLYASVSGQTDGGVTGFAVYPSTHGQGALRIYG
jgi:hypothetical protein